MRRVAKAALVGAIALVGCSRDDEPAPAPTASARRSPATTAAEGPPQLLYLPDGGDIAPPRAPGQQILPGPWGQGHGHPSGACPGDMVDVGGAFCIDRFEASLVDARRRELSPYYHPTRAQTRSSYSYWNKKRLSSGPDRARLIPVPEPPAFQLKEEFEARAVAQAGAIPNGYLNLTAARSACERAGKRLCTEEEWVTACRGRAGRKFPYGDRYERGRCNVYRETHPAVILHGKASVGHLDPRLNQTDYRGDPLLRPTGATPTCRSEWGSDAIYDMVGNLDEWIDDPDGVFVGGFFSRGTREGCDSRISAHAPAYFDYSLGVRCCK
jgi:formylglycine-generating enzyme